MKRLAIVARPKKGSESRASELIAAGPPFDLEHTSLARHSVYLSATEVVFVFEGHEVEWMVDRSAPRSSTRLTSGARSSWGHRGILLRPPAVKRP
jgi:hypothetical protein